jgi:RNA polymerase sigma-70 factor (family 1)
VNYSKLNDQELIEQLRSNNELAFRFIYDRFWEKMFFVAMKKISDIHDAEEIIQDIFSNLWKRRETVQITSNLESYLAGAVKFEVYKRRASRAKREFMSDELDILNERIVPHERNLFDIRMLEEELANTVNSLPPKCQLVFTKSRKEGLSNKEIAETLNISEKAVEKHITNALRVIKGHFGRFFYLLLILKGLI